MQLKKWICMAVVLMLLLSILPGNAVAAGPLPSKGNHIRWIDRIANLPDYAGDFYEWLEHNATADGALADPTRGTRFGSGYVHEIHKLKGSISIDSSIAADQIQSVILREVDTDAQTVMDYTFAVYGAFDRDHPEVFWLSAESVCGMSLQYSHNKQNNLVTYELSIFFYLCSDSFDIRLECYRDPAIISDAISKRDGDICRILSECPADQSAAEQVRYLNRVLTQTNCYNSMASDGNNAAADPLAWKCVSALSGSVGEAGPVCEGYARAFKVLCDRLGIPCVLTEGYARGSAFGTTQLHMWNYVYIDGSWYAVDATWNDPIANASGEAALSGRESEKYLLIGSDTVVSSGLTFSDSHLVRNAVNASDIQFINGPVLAAKAYEFTKNDLEPVPSAPQAPGHKFPDHYMDIAPYRSGDVYTAPEKEGFVFTGWFADEALSVPLPKDVITGKAYAGFVDDDVLSVKCQISDGTTAQSEDTDLRLLTGISTTQLEGVTFRLSWENRQFDASGLYQQVLAHGMTIAACDVFGEDAAYFVTCTVTDVPRERFDELLTVVPGWYTADGTFVTGTARTIRIIDGI